MLAKFGIQPEVDEFFGAFTYVFRCPQVSRCELLLTFSTLWRYIALTLSHGDEQLFTIDMDRLSALRLVSEQKTSWLQASFDDEASLPDLIIQIEPTIQIRWSVTPLSRRDIP
ncbi:hypothetical protein SAMN03159496_01178 [Rhizobium sp. NFR07]|nr:hypothetical protein SAMN03159496_01178 [Rhizobium sp. NFR07]